MLVPKQLPLEAQIATRPAQKEPATTPRGFEPLQGQSPRVLNEKLKGLSVTSRQVVTLPNHATLLYVQFGMCSAMLAHRKLATWTMAKTPHSNITPAIDKLWIGVPTV